MSIALYKKAVPNLKPCLIYATEDEVTAFHEDNTPELRPDNLIKYYDEAKLLKKVSGVGEIMHINQSINTIIDHL